MPTEKQLDKMLKHAEEMERRRVVKAAERAARKASNRASVDAIVAASTNGTIDFVTLRRNAINSVAAFAQMQVPDLLTEWLELIQEDDPSSVKLAAIQAMIRAATGDGKYFTGPRSLAAAMKGLTVEEQYIKVNELYATGLIPEEQSKALLAIIEAADKSESRKLREEMSYMEAELNARREVMDEQKLTINHLLVPMVAIDDGTNDQEQSE